jgi:hypothetical protein
MANERASFLPLLAGKQGEGRGGEHVFSVLGILQMSLDDLARVASSHSFSAKVLFIAAGKGAAWRVLLHCLDE